MSYKREREYFIATWARVQAASVGMMQATADARTLLRYARTLQRLAEAQCNGDYPADNGQRAVKPCDKCASLWAPEVLNWSRPLAAAIVDAPGVSATREYRKGLRFCPDCRITAKVQALAATYQYLARVGGDPRGYVVVLFPMGTDDRDIESGRERGVAVPA
jgi:hypothetical protein